jgi:signal transduction histidine kinase
VKKYSIECFSSLSTVEYISQWTVACGDNVQKKEKGLEIFAEFPLFLDIWYFYVLVGCVVLVIGFAIIRHRRQTGNQQDLFTYQLLDSMEAERKRIASELHDSIGQELLIIKNRALLALSNLKDKKSVREQLEEISNTASQALQETREITYNLRPYQIDRLGLTKAIESIINRVERTTTIKFTSDIDPIDNLVPKEMEIHVYRIIQECINNIIKHANATTGKVIIKRWSDRLNIDVEDNGKGFDVSLERSKDAHGMGIHGIAERTRLLGGTMKVESSLGNGTRVLITIILMKKIDAAN